MPAMELGALITQLGGGLALFLYGMRRMTEALKTVAGEGMKDLLARLTRNRFTAALAGIVVTAVIQSSSVTTVLVVGFISAGLLNLGQSIGVILGANVGTTITAQIVAFSIYKYGLLLIAVGFFSEVLARRERVRQWSKVVLGLGFILFGMELMSIATSPLRDWPAFTDWLQHLANPLLAIALGGLFTALVQSSSATTAIVIVLASQGLMTLETGIGLLLGANVGTCMTAFVSAIGRPREALQAAWAHVIFNVAGVLLWLFFIPQLADLVRLVSPVSAGVEGVERMAADMPRQVANAHTLFNVVNLLLFIWFTEPLSRLVERIAPKPPVPEGMRPLYLDALYLEQPSLALDQAQRELLRLGGLVQAMLERSMHVVATGSRRDADELVQAGADVDVLSGEIIRFLGKLSQKDLVGPQPAQLTRYIGIANLLENIGDVIEKDLLDVLHKRTVAGLTISESTRAKLRPIAEEVAAAFAKTLAALESGDTAAAVDAIESKEAVSALAEEANAFIAKRLVADEPHRLETFRIETDIIDNYRRLNTYTRRIARAILESHSAPAEPKSDNDAEAAPDAA